MGKLKKGYKLSTVSLTILVVGLIINAATSYKTLAVIIMASSIVLNLIGIRIKMKETKNRKEEV
jgi:hypothetical protein